MPYSSKEDLEQDIQEVKNMLLDTEEKMNLNNISWKEQMNLYLFRMHIIEKLSNLNYQLSIYQNQLYNGC